MEPYTLNRSGLYVPERVAKRPIAIDLFCGAGGFTLGFLQAGFEVIAGLDNDIPSALTYLYNLGSYPVNMYWIEPGDKERFNNYLEKQIAKKGKNGIYTMPVSGGNPYMKEYPPVRNFFFGDARKITGQEILGALGFKQGDVDCVMGGPPCQGFSITGKRDVMDPRNSLVFEFARLVLEIQPKTMIMENVPGILSMVTPEGIPVVDAFCRVLEDGGFGAFDALKQSLLNTAGAGAALKGSSRKPSKRQVRWMETGIEDENEGLESKKQLSLEGVV